MNALRYLTREYGICDENGNNYFLDYFIRTQNEKRYAVERKWTEFSSSTDYRRRKIQKTVEETEYLCLWGIKLFRFSREDCAFENRIEDDIKQYFGKRYRSICR